MRFKYPIRFRRASVDQKQFIKARSLNEAYIKLLKKNKVGSITLIALDGQPVPTTKHTAAQLIRRKNKEKESKAKQLQGMFRYFEITGKSVFDK